MHNNKIKPVDEMKMLALCSLLSKYDLFHVSADNGKEFNATSIISDADGYIEFKRLFATSVYSKGYVVDIQAISDTEFVCKTSSVTYQISALHNKPLNIAPLGRRVWREISDLMDTAYIGERFTNYIKELDMLVLAVDPWLLGELHPVEQRQIQRIINVYLDGYSNSMQMSRTICFQVRLHDGNKRIYAGVYDLEGQISISSVLLYDDRDINIVSDNLHKKAQRMFSYAEKFIPKK